MSATDETKQVGISIARRIHQIAKEVGYQSGCSQPDFCDTIRIHKTTFSTLLTGNKILNAVNLYYLIKEYPKIDLYWLLTGEKSEKVQSSDQEEKSLKTTPISIEERLAAAQEEITFLREQNKILNQSILNLSQKL